MSRFFTVRFLSRIDEVYPVVYVIEAVFFKVFPFAAHSVEITVHFYQPFKIRKQKVDCIRFVPAAAHLETVMIFDEVE